MKPNLDPSTLSEPAGVLNYFTQTPILRQIGHRRLAKLLNPFNEDLKASNLMLPEPDPQNDDYFADLANALSITERLPRRLRETLLTIELAASPENDKPLWCVINRRLPGVSVADDCALDRALDLWFLAPEELSQFITPKSDECELVPPALHSLSGGGSEGGSPPASPIQLFNVSTPPQPPSTLDPQLSTDSATFAALARLSPAQYDRVRKAEAKRLDLRIETLDREVAKARAEADYDDQARAIKLPPVEPWPDRKSTRLNSSHTVISYAVFCLKKKNKNSG